MEKAATTHSQLNGSNVETNTLLVIERASPSIETRKTGADDINPRSIPRKRGRPTTRMTKHKNNISASKTVDVPIYEREEQMTRQDVKCPICFCIFFEPVTFPCKHSMCLDCFKQHVEKTSLQCPMCRFRLSVWSRTMSKHGFVNTKFWERIKKDFSEEILLRQEGSESQEVLSPRKDNIRDGCLASQGEISQEFAQLQKKHSDELENERLKEEAATQQLIIRLEEEEGPFPPIQLASELEEDLELAKKIQEDLDKETKINVSKTKAPPLAIRHGHLPTEKVGSTRKKTQKKLEFKKVSLELDPASTSTSSPLFEKKAFLQFPAPPPPGVSYEEDFKLAKKLQMEERKKLEQERLNARERMTTRQLSKDKGQHSDKSTNDMKRSSSQASQKSSQASKRQKPNLSNSQSQRTMDKYVTRSPPSAAAGAPPRSSSNSPDSIGAETSHHFTPIVRPPKTPPRVNPDGTVEPAVFVNLLPKNLHAAIGSISSSTKKTD